MLDAIKDNLTSSGKDEGRPGLDFLPSDYSDRRRRRRTNAICLLLFIIVVGVVGATFHFAEKALAETEQDYRRVDEQYASAAERIEQVKQMRLKQQSVSDHMELTASLLEKLPRTNLLAEVTNALPGGISLTELSLEATRDRAARPQTSFDMKSAAANPAPPQPLAYYTVLTVTGVAYTEGQVSDYIDRLTGSSYFRSVDLRWVRKGSVIDRNDETMRTFLLAITIEPTAEARRDASPRRLRGSEVRHAGIGD